ncbi:hypothetical protein MB84_23290 [Pandoraea oxalativorans]|uniref:Uncharacterized protein n=1 Tax=Pandoraea oxalativorans TaxID=573737 RepID=A0A0E3U8Z1_9BURK|nr:hypothetical protein MB84_23290 [Pandoraea oxalativorans]
MAVLLCENVAIDAATGKTGAHSALAVTVVHVQVIDEREQDDLSRHVGEYGFESGCTGQFTAQDRVQAGEGEDRERSGDCEKRR